MNELWPLYRVYSLVFVESELPHTVDSLFVIDLDSFINI